MKTTPPRPTELELSLFGAGIGECAVVHLGAGNWMVVDSCLNEARERPIALDYLEGVGVDVARQVKLVVVTHWHDDHIRGISQLVRFATSARFVCSVALRSDEFLTLVVADEEIKLVEHTSGVSEFADVLEILRTRNGGRCVVGPDHWATSGLLLYSDDDPSRVEVHALSPSAQSITDSKRAIAGMIPSVGEATRKFPVIGPNDLSVVLLVKTTGSHLLLGADLETGRHERRGWRAVLSSELPPRVESSAYKVAHHGSENADHDGIWDSLLVKNVRAMLTPYARGPKPRPSSKDLNRIKSRTRYLYSTIWPHSQRPPRRRGADKTINEIARKRRAICKRPGHIRLRVPIAGQIEDISVELFDGAKRL